MYYYNFLREIEDYFAILFDSIITNSHKNDYDECINKINESINEENNVIDIICKEFNLTNFEKIIYIKTLLVARFYELINYYMDYDYNSALDEEYLEYEEEDFILFEQIEDLDNIHDVIKFYNTNYNRILSFYDFYINLSKSEKENVQNKIITVNKESFIFKICPIIIFDYYNYFDIELPGHEPDFIRLGNITLDLINCQKQNCNSEEENYYIVYQMMQAFYIEENINKWFLYIISNVYENLIYKDNKDKYDKYFINMIESNIDVQQLLTDENLIMWSLMKFYEFNSIVYDKNSLTTLRDKLSLEKKQYVKRIDPYYQLEENVYKNKEI